MDFKKTKLYLNHYLDEFDKLNNWTNITSNSEKCVICEKIIQNEACKTESGLECATCVLDIIKNNINAEKIDGYTLNSLRRVMSFPNSLRWRFFFLLRFKEIYKQESSVNQFGLNVLLIEQLGYVTSHPLSTEIRQLAFDVCLGLGENIMELLTKLYRRKPWQFNINVVVLAGRIDPAYEKVSFMVEEAADHSNVEVRQRVVFLLKDINRSKYRWAKNLMLKMRNDPDSSVREMAKKYVEYLPYEKIKNKQQVSLISEEQRTGKDLMDLYEEYRNRRTYQHYAIEDLVAEIYSATTLKKIFTLLLIPLFLENKLIEQNIKSIHKVKKNYLSTIFAYIILENNLFQLMINNLPNKVRTLFELLVWEGGTYKVTDIEKKLGVKIFSPPTGGYYNANDLINPQYLIFQFQTNYDYFSSKNSNYIYLDDKIRNIFKKHLPLPKEAVLKSIEKIPHNLNSYADENQFVYQVDIFMEFIRQGNIQYAKTTGNILKSSLRKWNKYFNIKEFYQEEDTNLTFLFANLVVGFLMKAKSKKINLKEVKDIKKMILDFFELKNFFKYRFFKLLPHIQGYFYITNDLEKKVRQSIFKVLKSMSDYEWIAIENLLMNLKCNDEAYYLSEREEIENYLYFNAMEGGYYNYNRIKITSNNYNDVFLAPLVKSIFFLFASLGIVNIAYDYPQHDRYQIYNREYLTVFDGLKYVKLSDFGKYILSITDSYNFKTEKKPTKVLLDEKRLIIRIEGDGRLERMVLDRFADQIGENYYKISNQSFLENCHSKNDIKNNVSIFKDKLSSNPPLIWNEFFKEIENKINPLQFKDDIRIYKIKPGKEIISLIARDETLKRNILKVEDYHIAIERRNINKVKKRLRKFGFFIDNI